MKTKKKFFLKGAGISLAKAAGISLALVMMFAACDNDGTSSSKSDPSVSGPSDMGTGPTAESWAEVESYLASSAPEHATIYIRKVMTVPSAGVNSLNEVVVGAGKTLVITGERTLTGTTAASVEGAAEGTAKQVLSPTGVPRLYIDDRAKLTVASGGRLVLGGPKAETYGGIVDVLGGGALHVEKGAILALNMSSRVFVSGDNPSSIVDYVALNIESESKLGIVGDFVLGDTIIATNYDERTLIGITNTYSPVALGAALVYTEIPTLNASAYLEENKARKGTYDSNKTAAARYSRIKVAHSPQEVLDQIALATSYPLDTLIYSYTAALIGNKTVTVPGFNNPVAALEIPASSNGYSTPTTLVIESNVQQNSDIVIQGAVEIAAGASLTVIRNERNTPAMFKIGTYNMNSPKATLNIVKGATLAVGAGGTLDLQAVPANATSVSVTVNGEIAVAAGGAFLLPPIAGTYTMPQVDWGTGADAGFVTLNAGSAAYLDITGAGTGNGTLTYYIGSGLDANAVTPQYTWAAGDVTSTVTLVDTNMTLKGYLTVTGGPASYTAIAKKATIASGVLTVAAGLGMQNGSELEVASGASIVVEDDGNLSFQSLDPPLSGKAAPVTLYGNIEVKAGGIIGLPAAQTSPATVIGKVTQINYAGGVIKLDAGSILNQVKTTGGQPDLEMRFGPKTLEQDVNYLATTKVYEWLDKTPDTSYVDITNDNMVLYGTLKVVNASATVYNKFTISSNAVLTIGAVASIATANTLKLVDGAKLVVDGKIDVEATTTTLTKAGTLDLETNQHEPIQANNETAALTLNGNITAGDGATVKLLDLASDQIAWGANGEIKFIKGSTLNTKIGSADSAVYLGTSGPFQWNVGAAADSVSLKSKAMIVAGQIKATGTASAPNTITDKAITIRNKGKLSIEGSDVLLLSKNASITVEDGGELALGTTGGGGATLAIDQITSKLVLNPGATLSAASVDDTIKGWENNNAGLETAVTFGVTQTPGGNLTRAQNTAASSTDPITANTIPIEWGISFDMILGRFQVVTYPVFDSQTSSYVEAYGQKHGTGAIKKLIAGRDKRLANNSTVYDAYITFAGKVDPDA
jgi:hypothetical protein